MTALVVFIGLLGILLFQLKCLDIIYLFQIKEYRFDRFFVFLKENNLIRVFYLNETRMPKKSLRNMLLTGISWVMAVPFIVGIPIYIQNIYKTGALLPMIVMILISPFTAYLSVSFAVIVTEFFARQKRESIIEKARHLIDASDAVVIGITGSYGKSSVKEFLFELLKTSFPTAKTDENKNTDVGVALSVIKNLKPDTKFFVAEMGAYRIGEIKKICSFMYPKFGIITAIGNQHLALFGSKKNLVKAKKELAESLPLNGALYVGDTVNESDLVEDLRCRIVYYSKDATNQARYQISNNTLNVFYMGKTVNASNETIGEHNLYNLVPAILLALDLGVEPLKIEKTIPQIRQINGKLTESKGINESIILNDVYSSNLNGFIAAIDKLNKYKNNEKLVVTRGIIELGNEKGESYNKILNKISQSGIQLLSTDHDFLRKGTTDNIILFNSEQEMEKYLRNKLNKKSVLLIEGRFPDAFIKNLVI